MQRMFPKLTLITSMTLIVGALNSSGQITITREPCLGSVCLGVPGVPPPPSGGSALATQDFNSSDGGCTVTDVNGPFEGPWTYNSGAGTWSSAGQQPELMRAPSTRLTCTAVTLTQAGNVRISFNHRYSFEDGGGNWDGGAVQVSVNGSTFVTIPASSFVQNGYNGQLRGDSVSELHGQDAFVSTSAGYDTPAFITSVADLGCLSAGDTVSVRFLAAFDTNTRNGNPAWEIDSVSIIQGANGGQTARLAVFSAGESVSIRWQKSVSGGAFSDIPGAVGNFLSFVPVVRDNGNCYHAVLSASGNSATSAVACLAVVQPNTAPSFVCGTNQVVLENSGPQSVLWAQGILPYSAALVQPITYASDFSSTPPDSQLFGVAAITGGALHLTTPQDSVYGAFSWNLPAPTTLQTFSSSWKSLIGGGSAGADGYSLNVANDLPYPPTYGNPGEEGAGTGLSLTFDTWDNGSPDIVGVEIRWQGAVVASAPVPKDDDGSGVFLRKNSFVNASVTVDAAGLATLNYDGTVISAQLPGYDGIRASRVMFGARTGNANDNHWIDDLSISATSAGLAQAEAGQTVSFIVSNDNPALFSTQPAVSANGTLTYTPAPNACGTANVTVVAKDDGGTSSLCGGQDTSAPCNFTIIVTCVNSCPVANGSTVSVAIGGTVNFQLSASDADGDALTFIVTTPPLHGALVVNANTGSTSYTPNPGYTGPDSFKFKVSDGPCQSVEATVSINVDVANQPPTARILAAPLVDFSPYLPNPVLISANGSNACLVLDGSTSSDPESPASALTYEWFLQPSIIPFATGAVATACVELGGYTFGLAVTDPQGATGTDTLTIDVLTPCEAEGALILILENSGLPRNVQRPLVSSVKAACASYEKDGTNAGVNQLQAFQNKVRTHVRPLDLALAKQLSDAAQAIIDALSGP